MFHFDRWLKRFVFSILVLTLNACFLSAQTLPIKNYSIQNGLPESRVYAVYLDPAGYLWAGTQSGACSFDGHKFHIFDSQSGLPDNHVTAISGGKHGQTWFGHRSGELSYIQDGHITVFRNKDYNNNANITHLLWHNNILYIATSGNGLYAIYDLGKSCTVRNYSISAGLADNVVNKLCIKNSNEIWVATNKGLCVVSEKSKSVLPSETSSVLKQTITALAQRGDTLFCATGHGLSLVVDGMVRSFLPVNATQPGQTINAIFAGQQGDLWLATTNGAIQIKGHKIRRFARNNGLLSDIIYDIGEDREHSIWIAQDDGVSCFRKSPFELFNVKDGLIYNETYSIEQDAKKNFWVGTRRGITILKTVSQGIKPIRNITRKDGLPDDFVYDLFRDSRGNMWIACAKKGAACYITAKNKFLTFDRRNGLAGKEVVSINEDIKGRIWLATLDSGIAVYDYAKNKIRSFKKNKGFVSNTVWDIHRDQKGRLWFGTHDRGLVQLDNRSDRFKVFNVPGVRTNYDFASITSDKLGNIWIATIGDGVLKYDGSSFEKYGFRNGLKSNNPYFIFCDKEDEIWIGTNLGLDHLNTNTKTAVNYLENDGFLGIETNQNAIHQSENGDLWIGTVKGLMHYNRQSERVKAVAPLIYITNKQVFFKDDSIRNNKLRHDQNYLTFEFNGVTLNNADKVLYKYKLSGLSDKWSPEIAESRVSYASLAPGGYTFMVKAGFSNGNWSRPAAFSFRIVSPFYRTWWFILLTVTLICLIGCWIYQYRVEQLLKFQKMRNKIASDLHDDIGSALTSISIFSEVADQQLKKHGITDTREVIGHIAYHSRAMLEAMEDIVWAVDPRNDHFNDLFVRMREFAIPLLEAREIDFNIVMDKEIEDIPLIMAYRRNLYLVFKEAVNNILKHSRCSFIDVRLKKENKSIVMTVSDNGKGFNSAVRSNRNGLKNMEKRAAEMNAQVNILSDPGRGTVVTLIINII